MMRHDMRYRAPTLLRRATFAVMLIAIAGCGDVLAVAGLSNLEGYWTGRYDSDLDFYLDLDDDLYGVYGKAGFTGPGGGRSSLYVDGERDGSRIVFYDDEDSRPGDPPVFEGQVTGRDRIDGIVYIGVPRHVVLRRD